MPDAVHEPPPDAAFDPLVQNRKSRRFKRFEITADRPTMARIIRRQPIDDLIEHEPARGFEQPQQMPLAVHLVVAGHNSPRLLRSWTRQMQSFGWRAWASKGVASWFDQGPDVVPKFNGRSSQFQV